MNNQLELEEPTKKLMDNLINVRLASIPRWNEHKDVKEDKERDPCFFGPHDKFTDVDPKRPKVEKPAEQKRDSIAPVFSATSMMLSAIRGFKH